MYTVQQVRLIRRGGAARRTLHSAPQRRQREDLHLPMVLVRYPRNPNFDHRHLPHRHHLLPTNACLHDANEVQTRQARQRRHHRQAKQDGRLVSTLHPWGESRLGDIQRYNARVCEQAEPQLPASYPWGSGRVTSDTRVGVHHVTDVSAARHGPARLRTWRPHLFSEEFKLVRI